MQKRSTKYIADLLKKYDFIRIRIYDIMSKPVYLRNTSGISIPFSV